MANWTKNPPEGANSRRKWDLEDRTSLNNLKYHIAAEGCSDVQYDLAKKLLEKSIDQDEIDSSQKAVYWLCCAAQQGHDDAAKLLLECYSNGRGITTDNETEVQCCLSMTPGERAARKAARELFACLSNGGEHITPKKLERKMREIYKLQKKRRRRGHDLNFSTSEEEEEEDEHTNVKNKLREEPAENAMRRRNRSRRYSSSDVPASSRNVITEENLLSAAVNYASGRLPTVNDSLAVSVPRADILDHIPCFHRLFFHPIIFLTLLYHRLVNFIVQLPNSVPKSVRWALFLLAYWFISYENLVSILPIGFYYLTLAVMIWSTCLMLKIKHQFHDFRIWSALFLNYGDHNIEVDMSENRFLRNNLKPYLYFFLAFVGNVMIYPQIQVDWLLSSELTLLTSLFCFITLIVFMYASTSYCPDWTVLVSFGVNLIAKYPYDTDHIMSWRFLSPKSPAICNFLLGNGIELCVNCHTIFYLLIPVFLITMAKRSKWHGVYTFLVPHCVTLSWMQLCFTYAHRATSMGILRASLFLTGMMLFLPLFGVATLMIPVFTAIEWLGLTKLGARSGFFILFFGLCLLGSFALARNQITKKYVTAIQFFLFLLATILFAIPHLDLNMKDFDFPRGKQPTNYGAHTANEHISYKEEQLTWQQFEEFCIEPGEGLNNKIETQMRCAHLEGTPVAWEGVVSTVQINRVYNTRAEYITNIFPQWLANTIFCFFGEEVADSIVECDETSGPICSDVQRIVKNKFLAGKCTLHKWNSYEYEILVKMPGGGLIKKSGEVLLLANNQFGNFTNKLQPGDIVHFFGSFINSRHFQSGDRVDYVLGRSSYAHLRLVAIKCLKCEKRIKPVNLEQSDRYLLRARMRNVIRGAKYLLNLLFNPLITFK